MQEMAFQSVDLKNFRERYPRTPLQMYRAFGARALFMGLPPPLRLSSGAPDWM